MFGGRNSSGGFLAGLGCCGPGCGFFGLLGILVVILVFLVFNASAALPEWGREPLAQWIYGTPQPTYDEYEAYGGAPGIPPESDWEPEDTGDWYDGYEGPAGAACSKLVSTGPSYVTTCYGKYPNGNTHGGIDYGAVSKSKIVTPMSGKVIYAGWNDQGYGNLVIVENQGYQVMFAHGTEVKVSYGDSVNVGDVVMLSGSTGNSTGPHLHFEIRKCSNGACNHVNPNETLLPGQTELCNWYAAVANPESHQVDIDGASCSYR